MYRMCAIKNKLLAPLGALLCLGLLSGCSGQAIHAELQELEQLELVETLGADAAGEQVIVSVSTNAGAGDQSSEGPTVLVTAGSSVVEALEHMPAFTPKRFLFLGHTQHFVLGQAAAEAGLGPYMDYVERTVTMRMATNLYIVKDGSAQEVITGENDISAMLDSLKINIERQSEGYVYNFNDVAQSLMRNGAALVAAVEAAPAERYQPDTEGEVVRFAGYALIRDGKLAAFADEDCSKGINLLTEKVRGGILTVPDGAGGFVSLNLTQAELELEPRLEAGTVTGLDLTARLKFNLEGLQHDLDVYDPQVLQALEAEVDALETGRIREALELAQGLETDFYGLGKRLELKDKAAYQALGDWAQVFPALSIEPRVESEIVRSYDIGGFVQAETSAP